MAVVVFFIHYFYLLHFSFVIVDIRSVVLNLFDLKAPHRPTQYSKDLNLCELMFILKLKLLY